MTTYLTRPMLDLLKTCEARLEEAERFSLQNSESFARECGFASRSEWMHLRRRLTLAVTQVQEAEMLRKYSEARPSFSVARSNDPSEIAAAARAAEVFANTMAQARRRQTTTGHEASIEPPLTPDEVTLINDYTRNPT